MKTKSADISGRGCYVETLMPLPVGKALQITFWIDTERIPDGGNRQVLRRRSRNGY